MNYWYRIKLQLQDVGKMKIVKPLWVKSKDPLLSCDVHPDGKKFATSGQGEGNGRISIWHMAPVTRRKSEASVFKKCIATLEHHEGCVNCVRWSHSGVHLASSSDDKTVMIWAAVRYEGCGDESYKCVHILRGHNGDVLDLAWSPSDAHLASTSIDNSIIVWNCANFPEKVTTIRGHQGMVKGVVWDPVGRYLATQSTDRTLRVWRVCDWQEEAKVTDPFNKCGGTTTVLRIGWSPDGQYIVSSHAMNNEGPVAKIIERTDWQARMDFVGHRRAIESVRFNPHLFYYNNHPASCVAIAGRDNSISVWLTALKRPLFVLHDLFSSSVLDMSWTPDGYGLIVCSLDGSLAYLELTTTELGKSLTPYQTISLKNSLYGNLTQDKLKIIENPDLIQDELSEESEEPMETTDDEASTEVSETSHKENGRLKENGGFGSAVNNNANGHLPIPDKLALRFEKPSVATAPSFALEKQIETKTKDGRRRIMPITLKESRVITEKPSLTAPPPKRILLTSVSNSVEKALPAPSNTVNLRDVPAKLRNQIPRTVQPATKAQTPATTRLFGVISGCRIEVNNTDGTLSFGLGSRKWRSVVSSKVRTLTAGERCLVLGCEDGSLYVYGKEGTLLLPILNVGCSISKSAVCGDFVAVITGKPAVCIWNIATSKSVLKDESLGTFVSGARVLCSLTVDKEGRVTVGLSDGTCYCYSSDLAAWMLVGRNQLDGAWYKELHTNTPGESSNQPPPPTKPTNPEHVHLNTVLMLEQRILVGETTGALPECGLWLRSLVRYTTQQQDEERLRAILQRVVDSPVDTVFGEGKIPLLKELLKIVATNVNCQRLYSDFKQQVEWAETRR